MARGAFTQALPKVPAPCQLSCGAHFAEARPDPLVTFSESGKRREDIALLVGRKTKNFPHEVSSIIYAESE
jgi:hypothetical protein